MKAKAATFTGDRVNLEIINGSKSAHFLTQATLGAFFFLNNGNPPTPKLVIVLSNWFQNKMKVSGIYITVGQYLISSQGSKGTYQTGLARSTFTA